MGANTGKILKQLEISNSQSIYQKNGEFGSNLQIVDWKLAYCIYLFLIGRLNYLPHHECINDVVKEYDDLFNNSSLMNEKTISIGGGVFVKFNDGFLIIESEEPITAHTVRHDCITCDKYYAYARSVSSVDSDARARIVDINVNEMPKYDERRIEFLQQYLKEYMELYGKTRKTK